MSGPIFRLQLASLPLHTPTGHVLIANASHQRRLERFDGLLEKKQTYEGTRAREGAHWFRQFPVEATFFRAFHAAPCTRLAEAMPPADSWCDHEPKFSCGPISAFENRADCQFWSIGSRLQHCFEHFAHMQAPSCTIQTFDPVVKSNGLRQLAPYVHLHAFGLSHVSSDIIMRTAHHGR